jgi:hypothetical protein
VPDGERDELPERVKDAVTLGDALLVVVAERVRDTVGDAEVLALTEAVDRSCSGGGVTFRTLLPLCSETKMPPLGATAM